MPQSIRCVSAEELRVRSHRAVGSRAALGLTIRTGSTRVVLLDWKKVCFPLSRYLEKRAVRPDEVIEAVALVLHEKAHVNGVWIEWKAECAAIPGVLSQLRRWGYDARQVAVVKWYLTVRADRGRVGEYKLRGRCRV